MNKNRRMISLLLTGCFLLISLCAGAQEIKATKELPATPVKNQANSGTCWSFAAVSLIESELIRMGKGEHDLSEMYFVWMAYLSKADRYFRLQGENNFSGGGQAHDVTDVWSLYGGLPEDAFSGLLKGSTKHDHMEMDAVLAALMKTVVNPEIEKPDTKWRQAYDSVLSIYLGKIPFEFTADGKKYSSQSYARSLGIYSGDYIELTSFTHQPFYRKFVLEVPDNWSAGLYYNLPLDELIQVMVYALENGYTFSWDGDVSGPVSFGANNGIALMSDEATVVSQEQRQQAFDQFITTDDHLMHITGLGSDENGRRYFLTKNSWGTSKGNKGYWWMSENYLRMNTICIMLHKNALPEDVAVKLGLE
jgi:bleomycin hydrolase